MAKNPSNLNYFGWDLLKRGHRFVTEIELNKENDYTNPHKVFVNAKPLYNLFRNFGFHQEIIIRTRFKDNKPFAEFYIKRLI